MRNELEKLAAWHEGRAARLRDDYTSYRDLKGAPASPPAEIVQHSAAVATIRAAIVKIERLQEAVSPFAQASDTAGSVWPDDDSLMMRAISVAGLTYRDLRRARDVLKEHKS